MKIYILGTGCAKCNLLANNVQKAVEALNLSCEIEKVEDIDAITEMGVMMTPALIVENEILVEGGEMPSVDELKERLSSESSG